MELKFTKEQMILILKEYYKNYFDIEGEIEIKAYASQVGYEIKICSFPNSIRLFPF